jgi:2-methylisocitrate lyase-like PEP mutase family enzyme
MSANAISVTGELVNLDGIGNRTAALAFGPKKVIVIAGINKVAPTLEAAIQRAKNYAAPHTLMIFKQDYSSLDELSQVAESAYSHLLITGRATTKGRIHVILVGENLGF